jgi:hypothetical protein
MFSKLFSNNLAVYKVMWKNMGEPDRLQITVRHTRIACWITKATDTPTLYVIGVLVALPLQQCLHEHNAVLRYTGVLISP